MILRRATIEDADMLGKLAATTFYDTFTGTCTVEDMDGFLADYFNPAQVQKELVNPNDYFYLALINDKAVGYVRFMEDYSAFDVMKQWKALELKRLYISKDFHGKGVAQALTDLVFQFAKDNSYEVVWLGVWEYNFRAQQFYKKMGFTDTGHKHPFPIGSTPQTDLWYWKFL